jgi:hypothetical protein
MCTALLSIEPGHPTLLVGVRDELHSRAWEPPARHWPARPDLIGGRDIQAGGTWLAVSPSGRRAACVLNARGRMAPADTRRSRGGLPLTAAAGDPLDRQALADTDPFHLLTVELDRALVQSWDGDILTERELGPGLHLAVNSGWAADLLSAPDPAGRPDPSSGRPGTAEQDQAANGRAHEVARAAYFLPRFRATSRPEPMPGQGVAEAWGEWFPLLNGGGLPTGDERALIVRRDLGDGRIWGTTSISLVAIASTGMRYDFTGRPGDPAAWSAVL